MGKTKFDFSGYATKSGLKCSDGRVINSGAFKHQHNTKVPLVWQHLHNSPDNVLGYAILEDRPDGTYCYGVFNDTDAAQNAKQLVMHGDIESLSIHANNLREQSKKVLHGMIREVSLVLSGANPGATIDNVSFSHGGEVEESDDDIIACTGLRLVHSQGGYQKPEEDDEPEDDGTLEHADDATVAEVFNTLNEEQKKVVYYLIGAALEEQEGGGSAEHSDIEGEFDMKYNVFAQNGQQPEETGTYLTHEQKDEIISDAKRFGTLKESFLSHAEEYGLDPIEILFPDAQVVGGNLPQMIKREDEWVSEFLGAATHTPFSRIKTVTADITADDARARGYVTGSLKKEEIIPLMKRVTTPTTIYKKQKLDRDDMVDITFDIVPFLKNEMRGMLNEELARQALLGDGRDVSDEDKINEQNIRPIALDNDSIYTHRIQVDEDIKADSLIDEFIRSRKYYKGSGNPTLYTSTDLITEMLLIKDGMGRRIYNNVTELASVLRVGKIVEVELMNEATRKDGEKIHKILGIVVNPKDYSFGADKGGQVAMFDDFDIDYNQYKYLIETRCSGALTRPKSALILETKALSPAG